VAASPAVGPPLASLTEWLRERDDAQLAELLRRRPDLALPAPADLPTLASRLTVRSSVQRAVDGLDAFTVRVLEAFVLAADSNDDVGDEAAARLLGLAADDIAGAVGELLAVALLWGERPLMHLLAGVAEAVGPHPAGLGRPAAELLIALPEARLAPVLKALNLPPSAQPRAGLAVAAELGDSARLRELLSACDDDERTVLQRLADGPPVGTVRHAISAENPAPSAVQRLSARGLLVPTDPRTVELPREVGLALRDVPAGTVEKQPPELELVHREPADHDRLGGTVVLEALRMVDALAASWTREPPSQLRAGGVSVRDLKRTARDLGVDETAAAVIIEVAAAAGLVNSRGGPEPVYLPTDEFDAWRERPPAQQWTELATAWLAMTRQPGLIGERDERGRTRNALGPDAERGTAPALRTELFDELAALPPGTAPADRDVLLRRLAWHAPRRAATRAALTAAMLAEADLLGLTAAGGLTGYSRTLRAGSRTVAEQVLAGALPEPVDHFFVQPDLTAVVPGPPTAVLAGDLALAADLESTGGASVYRFTPASVRRALDAGRSAEQVRAFVAQRSRTPVPQALNYLIADVARRHGTLRAGTASSYLRCDDEALLTRVLADRTLAPLQLHRITPEVVISPAPVSKVLDALRRAGFAPAAESPEGQVIALDAPPPRAPSRIPPRPVHTRGGPDHDRQLVELVGRLRHGDTFTRTEQPAAPDEYRRPVPAAADTMALLREAIRGARRVRLGCSGPDGSVSEHTIVPFSLAAGVVRGRERGSAVLQSFPVQRLTAVDVLEEDSEDGGDDRGEGAADLR
jgi:hypothetical protein